MKIKKTVNLTVEASFVIELDEALVSEEGLKAWSSVMWEVEDPEEIFQHVAYLIMKGYTECGHDMIGYLGKPHQTHPQVPDTNYSELSWDITDIEVEDAQDE